MAIEKEFPSQRLTNISRWSSPAFVFSFFALGVLASPPAWGGYAFTNVADTTTAAPTGVFTDFSVPSIEGGTLAFRGVFTGTNNAGVFERNAGGPIVTISKRGDVAPIGTFLSYFSDTGISGGAASFGATYSAGNSGIFVGSGGALITIAKKGDTAPVGTFTAINSSADISAGVAVFRGDYTGGRSGIFTGSGGALTPIAKSGDSAPSGTFSSFNLPAIDAGNAAFVGNYTGGGGIFIGSGGGLTTVVKSGDAAPAETFSSFFDPAISGGTAAFLAAYSTTKGIFRGSGGTLTKVVSVGDAAPVGTFTDFNIAPSILGSTVVFGGIFNSGGSSGIFTGSGGVLDAVLLSGDPLFGSTVTSVGIGANAYASDGSLAFRYSLADGRTGVATANVPEPSGVALAAAGLLSLMLRRRRAV